MVIRKLTLRDKRWRWIIIALLCPLFLVISFVIYFAFAVSTWDDRGFQDFCGESEVIQTSFQTFFKTKKDYPSYSMQQLQRMGALENEIPPEYWVYYTPFSSKTPDDTIVLRMGYGPFGFIPWLCDFSWTKYDLTHNSQEETNPWKDRLQVAKEKEVQQFNEEHPSFSVFSAFAWFNGTIPENSHAELMIFYRKPDDSQTYNVHYDLMESNDDWVVVSKTSK